MKGWLAALLVLLLGAVLCVLFFPKTVVVTVPPNGTLPKRITIQSADTNPSRSPQPTPQNSNAGTAPIPGTPSALQTISTNSHTPAIPEVAPTPASSTLPPETVLENMRTTIRAYASMFGENPVGTNAEITKTLQGENSRHVSFLKPEDGNRVNAAGELVDTWGTPYFFHQLSAKEMEIRSAGPDRKMYTSDDLVIH